MVSNTPPNRPPQQGGASNQQSRRARFFIQRQVSKPNITVINKRGASFKKLDKIKLELRKTKQELDAIKFKSAKKEEKKDVKAAAKKKFGLGALLGSLWKSLSGFGSVAAFIALGLVLSTMFANSLNPSGATTQISQASPVESLISFSPILIAGIAIALIALWYFMKKKE